MEKGSLRRFVIGDSWVWKEDRARGERRRRLKSGTGLRVSRMYGKEIIGTEERGGAKKGKREKERIEGRKGWREVEVSILKGRCKRKRINEIWNREERGVEGRKDQDKEDQKVTPADLMTLESNSTNQTPIEVESSDMEEEEEEEEEEFKSGKNEDMDTIAKIEKELMEQERARLND
ncbi:hypothetical protein Tco_1138725 [Tanacetum coccineum]